MPDFDDIIDPPAEWADIPQISTSALVLAGPGGPANAQAVAIAKRLAFLNEALNALQLADYTALRAYAGQRESVYVTGYLVSAAPTGIAGEFVRDDSDTASADNGGTIIVSAGGVRWKRAFIGDIYAHWFGATSVGNATAATQAAINAGIAGNIGVRIAGSCSVTKLTVQNAAYNFTLTGENAIITGIASSAQEGVIEVINCVSMPVRGFHISVADNANYASGIRVKAIAGTSQATTRVTFENITVRNAKCAYWVGTRDIDYQCSEITFTNCHAFACPQFLYGAGSQSGAGFVGCNMVSEYNAAFPAATLRVALLEGGFWYSTGSENVQTNAAGFMIEARPCSSALYHNPYPKWVTTGGHIESAGVLLYVNNSLALASPRSNASSFVFSNTGGYIPSSGPSVIDTTADNNFKGKIAFDSTCDFYGDVDGAGASIDRVAAHIVLGANTKIDMDGSPFGQSFKQGLSGINTAYRGKPRLRGETILARYGSTTSIASGTATLVVFPSFLVTVDTGYGDATYSGGTFTADQDMKDVSIDYQLGFASSAPVADVWVEVAGVNLGSYAVKVSDTVRAGSVTIPSLLLGQTVKLFSQNYTGSAIALTGGSANFFRMRAKS